MKKGRKNKPQGKINKILKLIWKGFYKIRKFLEKWLPIILSIIALLLSFKIYNLGDRQFRVTKTYQDWTIKEMSRSPELYLKPREPDSDIEFIDKNIDSKAMIFRCNLVNSGDQIAKYIQIRHSLYLYYNSIVSIFVYSQLKEDLVFCNAGNHNVDVSLLGWKQTFLTRNKKKDKVNDSTICVYVPNVEDTVCFKVTNRNTVSMKVYKNQEIIYYNQNEGPKYEVKLPYVWLLVDLPSNIDAFYIPYIIDSDRGAFQGTLKIKNRFYNENKQ
jgi:hypothetical protein